MRALWLMNHTTLRKFEVPLLQKYGFEVYLPKIFPYDEGNLSASVTYELDHLLTIPKNDIETLNNHDFYSGVSSEVKNIINKYFDVVFFGFFPNQLAALVRNFEGILVMRPFGLANGVTYEAVTNATLGQYFLYEVEQLGKRFWFAQAYPAIADAEKGVYNKRAIHLPLGLANAIRPKTWKGGQNKILFVCPRIGSSPYFNFIYRDFKKNFENYSYIIGGAQPIEIDDPNAVGFLDRESYDNMMKFTQVMFYHSTERNHVHYHPFEAISTGMPLIFMANGLLDTIGGIGLPGRCETISEARSKIDRIFSGDKNFIQTIVDTQNVLLDTMTDDYCEGVWNKNFEPIISQVRDKKLVGNWIKPKKKVGVILPEAYRGGTLDVVKLLARMLKKGSEDRDEGLDVVFAHPYADFYSDEDFKELKLDGISRRQIYWETLTADQCSDAAKLMSHSLGNGKEVYVVPNDGANYMLDCDFWLITSDRIPHLLAPLRPYAIFVHDYLQRYFPSLFGGNYEYPFIENARNAVVVLANTPHTVEDCIGYAGIPKSRVLMVPHLVDLDKHTTNVGPLGGDFLIWTTNTGPHKNHIRCLEAFDRYYSILGPDAFDIHVTGLGTNNFDPDVEYGGVNEQILNVRKYLSAKPNLKNRIKFLGELDNYSYSRELASAKFLYHNVVMDNGTLCAVEAAYFGVPIVSSDYPPMRYISDRYSLNCLFFDPLSIEASSSALVNATINNVRLRTCLPNRKFLEELGWKKMAEKYWDILRVII